MREHPILFSAPMVRALLAGTKTQTRRVVPISDLNIKPQSNDMVTWGVSFSKPVKGVLGSYSGGRFSDDQARRIIGSQFCPYGQAGDRLWVRETWAQNEDQLSETRMDRSYVYRADGEMRALDNGGEKPWRPSIHMPRWASRITLEITGVRVERLTNISAEDAQAEGWPGPDAENSIVSAYPIAWFSALWEMINGYGAWLSDPWVWVIEFKRVT